jgi:hypothetical protein
MIKYNNNNNNPDGQVEGNNSTGSHLSQTLSLQQFSKVSAIQHVSDLFSC